MTTNACSLSRWTTMAILSAAHSLSFPLLHRMTSLSAERLAGVMAKLPMRYAVRTAMVATCQRPLPSASDAWRLSLTALSRLMPVGQRPPGGASPCNARWRAVAHRPTSSSLLVMVTGHTCGRSEPEPERQERGSGSAMACYSVQMSGSDNKKNRMWAERERGAHNMHSSPHFVLLRYNRTAPAHHLRPAPLRVPQPLPPLHTG